MVPTTPAPKTDKQRSHDRLVTGGLSALLVVVMLGFSMLTVSMIRTMHQHIQFGSQRSSENLLSAETAGIDRILTIYDASLRFAAETANNPIVRNADPAVRRLAMFDGVAQAPELGPVRLIDEHGFVVYDASAATPAVMTPAEARALAVAEAATGEGPLLSGPFPLEPDRFGMTVSHRRVGPDGRFSGIVVGTIDLDLFQREFAKLRVGPHDSVSLFSDAGVMLAHIPGAPLVGRSIGGSDLLKRFMSAPAGTIEAPAVIDGVVRVFSFRHIAPWHLFLDVGVSTEDLYAPWKYRTAVTVILMVVLFFFTVVILYVLRKDLRARHAAELELVLSEGRYRLLAESASDVIVRVDRSTIRTYVSPSCRQYGYEPAELVGLPSASWVHDDDLAAARAQFLKTIDEQVVGIITYRLRHKNGEYSWIESHLSPIAQGGYLAAIRKIDTPVRAAA